MDRFKSNQDQNDHMRILLISSYIIHPEMLRFVIICDLLISGRIACRIATTWLLTLLQAHQSWLITTHNKLANIRELNTNINKQMHKHTQHSIAILRARKSKQKGFDVLRCCRKVEVLQRRLETSGWCWHQIQTLWCYCWLILSLCSTELLSAGH